MIDETRVRHMAQQFQMNPSMDRRLLEGARDVSALRIGRRYGHYMIGYYATKGFREALEDAKEGISWTRTSKKRMT